MKPGLSWPRLSSCTTPARRESRGSRTRTCTAGFGDRYPSGWAIPLRKCLVRMEGFEPPRLEAMRLSDARVFRFHHIRTR